MSASEEFKIQIETFLQKTTSQINDKEILQELDTEYNNLMDQYSKLAIMSNEDLEGIENEITNLSNENSKLSIEYENLQKLNENQNKIIKNLEHRAKIEADKQEGLNEKIKILQNTLDSYSNKSNENEIQIQILNQTNSDLKNEYSNLKIKYNSLQDEMEIFNKNVKKNFSLEVAVKELTEENEKLHQMVKNLQNSEDYKMKLLIAQSELKELNEKYNFVSNSLNELKIESEKLSNENFSKFDVINNLQTDLKIKNYKIDELEKEKKLFQKETEEIQNKLKESDYSVRSKKVFYENQIKEFKKEIDKLIKSNDTLKKENSEILDQLKKVQHYTNFAKASKEHLSKKDFSILENMSRRVEELSDLNEHLKAHVQNLGIENDILKNKINGLENITFHYMKDDYTLLMNKGDDLIIPEEELIEIKKVKHDHEKLVQIVLSVKEENFKLKKDMAELTVDFNKMLRMNSEQKLSNLNMNNCDNYKNKTSKNNSTSDIK